MYLIVKIHWFVFDTTPIYIYIPYIRVFSQISCAGSENGKSSSQLFEFSTFSTYSKNFSQVYASSSFISHKFFTDPIKIIIFYTNLYCLQEIFKSGTSFSPGNLNGACLLVIWADLNNLCLNRSLQFGRFQVLNWSFWRIIWWIWHW